MNSIDNDDVLHYFNGIYIFSRALNFLQIDPMQVHNTCLNKCKRPEIIICILSNDSTVNLESNHKATEILQT